MKAVEFDWHNNLVRDTNISTLIQCVYHCCYLKSCKLGTKHVKRLCATSIHEYLIVNSREYSNTKTMIVSALIPSTPVLSKSVLEYTLIFTFYSLLIHVRIRGDREGGARAPLKKLLGGSPLKLSVAVMESLA